MSIFRRQYPKSAKFRGQYLFSNFDYGLYKQEVPRTINEQLASLALVGGRNIWNLHGALSTQYGYEIIGELDEGEVISYIPDLSASSQNLLLCTDDYNVYRYNSFEGVKKYKTKFTSTAESDTIACYDGVQMIAYDGSSYFKMGGRYDDADYVQMISSSATRTITQYGNEVTFSVSEEEAKYFWIDKLIKVKVDTSYYDAKVISVNDSGVTIIVDNLGSVVFTNTIDVGEKTLLSLSRFEFTPEDTQLPAVDFKPRLMTFVLNRLWIADNQGRIFYSAVGQPDNFAESSGAGYFYGFQNDSSPVLSIEEYYSGALITKQNGMYHLKLTTAQYQYGDINGGVIAQGTSDNYINIQKLNNIPQRTAGDHCIIGDEVIAYDITSGNICQAVMVNYFGNLQQGSILLHGSELDAENLGLYSATKRKLCYNFQEEVLLVYYSSTDNYKNSLVIGRNLSIFPREISDNINDYTMFQQGIVGFANNSGKFISDFKRGTTIPNISSIAEFEPIYLNGNKLLCGSIVEITELNNEPYNLTTSNAGIATQDISPSLLTYTQSNGENRQYPNMLYSNTANPQVLSNTVAEEAKWVYQKSNVTRIAAPLGGRNGLTLRLEFEPNVTFQVVAINLPDFSIGE